ncbi:MAG: molybdopterin-dependent oxidoreductase [Elusimicrobia bacterium]|nr:molybdopterin-dependent oxidoreductase [Elusimicrobiota bacterium]
MKNDDTQMHVRGASRFVDDIPAPGALHAVLFTSPVAKGRIRALDVSKAKTAPGIVAVYTHKDIPGLNQVGHVAKDQPLLAIDSVEYIGQPIALVVGETKRAAKNALKMIEADIEKLTPVLDLREAAAKGHLHAKRRVMISGDPDAAFAKCKHVFTGTLASGQQEHFYFETQRALAIPGEHDTIKVCASVQSPGAFHRHLAEVLGIPMHKVELDIRRLGGAFGGKESTAVWTTAPALAAFLLKRPVKLSLERNEDISTTGKRHAYEYDYKLGLDAEGRILAYEITLFQHAGACSDISLAVLGRSFLHIGGSYNIPNVRATAMSCRTNIPPNNAFRGFGVPQGTFAIEAALTDAAQRIGVTPETLKHKNLIKNGDTLPYGLQMTDVNAERCWETLDKTVNLAARRKAVAEYNKTHADTKRGLAVVPVCFGISFAQTALNQASSLVHIYVDGSVSVSAGSVEMGQGVNAKLRIVAARTLGVPLERVRVDTTNTSRIPNASPTSASTGADLNGMATKYACERLRARLLEFAAKQLQLPDASTLDIRDGEVYASGKPAELSWNKLAKDAQWARVDLGEHAFYATPDLYYDMEKERGRPFAYYSYATSVTEVLLDCVRGTYDIDSVDIVQDVGESLSPEIDIGQIEGAVIQGIGWTTIEQIRYAPDGRVLTGVNAYKVPDIKFCPKNFNIRLLKDSSNPYAVCNSKAIGEPPFVHGIGAYLAVADALNAARPGRKAPSLPLTPEKAFMYLYGPDTKEKNK